MPTPDAYGRLDDAALAVGLGLVLFGLVVLGVVETLAGSPHVAERVRVGVVVVHTSYAPRLRPYSVALGFVVLCLWGLARVGRAVAVEWDG